MKGFHGCYWRFDLGRNEGERIPLPDSVLRRTLGGVGLGAWLLHEEAPIGVDPFAPEAPLIFSFSPLVGTGLTTSAKFAVVAKSPLTGGISDALSSSHFAIAGKASGVDAIVLVGACAEPSDLVDGRLRPTESWGKSAEQTAKALASFGRVAAIGVAGERMVRFANLSADGRHAGRGGLGAVMGSKRLKAIAIRGEVETPVADPARVDQLARQLRSRAAGESTAKYRELGTIGNLLSFDRLGTLPTRNFQQSHFEGAERLSSEEWQEKRQHRRTSCASCTIGCEHRFEFNTGGDSRDTRVEYESLFALGPLLGIADPDVVLAAASRCDELGIDTISAGATLAFAMECGQRGMLADGPVFDEPEALLGWLDDIAHRRGIGDQLAQGSRLMAQDIGFDSIDFAPQVKGLELPGYEPRALQAMALGFAVGVRGADHNRSGAYEVDFSESADRLRGGHGRSGDSGRGQGQGQDKVKGEATATLAIETEDRAALLDSLILCKFVRGALEDFHFDCAELLTSVTGEDFSEEDLRSIAKRIVDLRKAFNVREGWRPEDDMLPKRFLTEAIPSGPVRGARLPRPRLEKMIREYNLERGWTEDGYPTFARMSEIFDELGLPEVERACGSSLAISKPERVEHVESLVDRDVERHNEKRGA
jgi:aldehyde:ferredoxin oxidoreductase